MSTKLYYTDLLKAIWMMQRFEVKLIVYADQTSVDNDGADNIGDLIPWKNMWLVNETIPEFYTLGEITDWLDSNLLDRVYVHPYSFHVFEPQPGDIVEIPDKRFMRCTADPSIFGPDSQSITCQFSSAEYYKRRDGLESKPFNMLTIILRDDKHFFVPQQEETS